MVVVVGGGERSLHTLPTCGPGRKSVIASAGNPELLPHHRAGGL